MLKFKGARNNKYYCKMTQKLSIFHPKSIFLLLTPEHGNYGDHAIALAQKSFFLENFPEYRFYDISYLHYMHDKEFLKRKIRKRDIIAISGGGYLGDVWPEDDEVVRSIVTEFPQNKVIIMPQTIYYSKELDEHELKEKTEAYSKHEKLLFCVRDAGSYEVMKKIEFIGKSELAMVPDMVMLLKYNKIIGERNGIGVCFRNDREAFVDKEKKEGIIRQIERKYPVFKFDTVVDYGITMDEREDTVKRKLDEISRMKVVITDRLHAMLFAVLTGTPCIVFDNLTHKISKMKPFLENIDYLRMLENDGKIIEAVEELYQYKEQYFEREAYKIKYMKIIEFIKQ